MSRRAEIDGDLMKYNLKPGQQLVVDTGNVAGFEPSVQVDIQTVSGAKNMLFWYDHIKTNYT